MFAIPIICMSCHSPDGADRRGVPIMLTLKDLKPGETARVCCCSGSGGVFQRLCEMGFVEGTSLRVVKFAPLGDPLEVEINSYHLSLRKAEAAMVEVTRT